MNQVLVDRQEESLAVSDKAKEGAEEKVHLIEYYDAIEVLLETARIAGDFRTHFGIADACAPEYCFIKAAALGKYHPEMFTFLSDAAKRLHDRIFKSYDLASGAAVLDVGCGVGGALGDLALRWPEASLFGINVNQSQLQTAHSHLEDRKNVKLLHGDFLEWDFKQRFQLTYFIESAFHISPKDRLIDQLSHITAPHGDVIFVDIFWSDNLPKKLSRLAETSGIFDYLKLSDWEALMGRKGFEVVSFDDLSAKVSHTIVIRTPYEAFEQEVLDRYFDKVSNSDALVSRAKEVYAGYRQLFQLMRKGYVSYGILRMRKSK